MAQALDYAAMLHQFCRERDLAQESAKTAITLCTEQGFAYSLAWGTMMHGWARADQGENAECIAQMRKGLAAIQATGAALRQPYYLGLLAEASGTAGHLEDGFAMLAEAFIVVARAGERWSEAELHRLKGELLLHSRADVWSSQLPIRLLRLYSPRRTSEESFRHALDVAGLQQAKSWELRAATSLNHDPRRRRPWYSR